MTTRTRFITVGGGGILVAVLVLMVSLQHYSQRSLQVRVRDASSYLTSTTQLAKQTGGQYEPYYLTTDYSVTKLAGLKRDRRIMGAADDIGDQFSIGNTNVLPATRKGG